MKIKNDYDAKTSKASCRTAVSYTNDFRLCLDCPVQGPVSSGRMQTSCVIPEYRVEIKTRPTTTVTVVIDHRYQDVPFRGLVIPFVHVATCLVSP